VTKKKVKSVVPIAKLKNNLRRIHMQCSYRAKAKARCKIDTATYRCEAEGCKTALYEGSLEKRYLDMVDKYKGVYEVLKGKIELDHIEPAISPSKGFGDWHEYIHRLWVDDNGYQGLCREHHAEKTKKEVEERAEAGTLKRNK